MYKTATTLDDLLNEVLGELLKLPFNVSSSRGTSSEIIGSILQLTNPRARLSRSETKGTVFSALGELLWYLSKSNKVEFISYYISHYEAEAETQDGTEVVHGGYGPRLFKLRSLNQIKIVIELLKKRPTSRRAVIQLFDAEDLVSEHKDIPCTCTLQFLIRDGLLHMFTSMRSNDAYLGLSHDIFAFTMLQEIMARSLSVELGNYNHSVGSLHLYEHHKEKARQYINEGFQATSFSMPAMPAGDPWASITQLLKTEAKIRASGEIELLDIIFDPYWGDLARLLQIYSHFKKERFEEIKNVRKDMASSIYDPYIVKKLTK